MFVIFEDEHLENTKSVDVHTPYSSVILVEGQDVSRNSQESDEPPGCFIEIGHK